MSETHFQNTETALKNQQASIQGLETQIGQLAKLIFERPQCSLPSNTESNPREQFNAITIQDEEGLIAPEPEPKQETMVGDKVLLDAADPHIATSEPNGAIPLTYSVFSHIVQSRFSNPHGRAHGRALDSAHTTRGDTAVRYGRVQIGQNFSLARDVLSGHGRATWLWLSLSNQHRRATHSCLGTVVEIENLARSCDTPVPTTRAQD
ncbi:hypothetical protein GOBAR_AA00198 [Gossypium barbadense]|uniref:Uncharacterized protein n=1 Tax=Gossypium barbadense TaxID=3634 RepID=A0A2P5YXQ9_GOSBA|nr:hypothetical protein GOBAR_AA00198 [Gossypium barbadense]